MTLAFSSTDDLLQQIGESVEEGLSNIDFSQVEQASSPFLQNFADCMRRVINGEFTSADGYFQALLSLFNQSLAEILPSLAAVFCIVVICGVARSMSDGLISPDTANAVSFVGVAVTVFSLCALAASLYRQVSDMVNSVAALSQAAMPVLLTLVIAGGGSAVSSVCQPSMVVFSSVIIQCVQSLLLPLSVVAMVFSAVSCLSGNFRVTKLAQFVRSAGAWVLGVLFTGYSAVTSVQGITAASIDGVSFRAARFAAKNYVPILGGYLSDGLDVVAAGTSLIKNSFGAVSMGVIALMTVGPVVSLTCANLGLQALAAVTQPVAEEGHVSLLTSLAKCLTFLIALVVAVAFMFCVPVTVAILCAGEAV